MAQVLSDEAFLPTPPTRLSDTGPPVSLIELLILKHLAVAGSSSGRGIARHICLNPEPSS